MPLWWAYKKTVKSMLLTVFHIVVPPGIATIYQVVEYRFFLKTAQLSSPPAASPSDFCFCASLQRMISWRKVSELVWIMDFQLPCFFIESAFENPQFFSLEDEKSAFYK